MSIQPSLLAEDSNGRPGEPVYSPASRRGQAQPTTGVLPYQAINALLRDGEIAGLPEIEADQAQPASLDLRLGKAAYRVRASFLPGPGMTVAEKLTQLHMHEVSLEPGAVLERGCVYIVPLMERAALPGQISGFASPKSSTGRLDIFTRLIADRADHFDRVPRGYRGPLYLEVAPRTFSIKVRTGDRLSQLRLQRGAAALAKSQLEWLQADQKLVDTDDAILRDGKIAVRVDLADGPGAVIGYRAKKNADIIDLAEINHYDPRAFWEPMRAEDKRLILDPDEFYILATREAVRVPEDHSAEMIPYDTGTGEFRVHYAGFFDPGFGCQATGGSKAVLEVRSYEVPFLLDDAQIVGWLRYDRLTGRPDRVYGRDIGSSYEGQGLKLAKQFRPWPD